MAPRIRLTVTSELLRELRWHLLDSPGGVTLNAGLARSASGLEFLLPGAAGTEAPQATVRVFRLPPALEGCSHLYWHAWSHPQSSAPHLELGLHDDRGCSAALFVDGQIVRVDEVLLAGAGMDRWVPGVATPDLRGAVPADGLHSRYAGALGGRNVHERLRQVACLGVGSTELGAAMALDLSRAGCSVVVVDAETNPSDVHAAARACRLVFTATNEPVARRQGARLAAALHRVHLDLETRVVGDDHTFRARADVRLLLPGRGCLSCLGEIELRDRAPPVRAERRGALGLTLDHLAAHAGMLLFERLVTGELDRSAWVRIEVAADGTATTRRMPAEGDAVCGWCQRWAGTGDLGLGKTGCGTSDDMGRRDGALV